MLYIPSEKVQEYVAASGSKVDIKSIARDIYEVQFPKLLADWLDPNKAIDTGKIKIAADQKTGLQGSFMFNMISQQYTDIFQGAFNIFNLQIKDVQDAAKLFG
jgi:hypothetical protein